MNPFFTAEDFYEYFQGAYPLGMSQSSAIVYFANKKLTEWIEKNGVRVYICEGKLKTVHFVEPVDATHQAILIDIQEIMKKPCEHEPARNVAGNYEPACYKCNVKLKPTGWEVADE